MSKKSDPDMSPLSAKIEAVLFVATKPMPMKHIASICDASLTDVEAAVVEISAIRNTDASGIHLVNGEEGVMLVSNPLFAETVATFAKEDVEPELTRPSLEALTIVAYRGPITKPEIEAIRGVNCTLILRNLLMRGLVDEREDAIKLQPVYSLTNDAMRYLGLHDVRELPDYDELHGNGKIEKLLATLTLGDEAV
jgi:segregation and condensation protein B